ncbi:MAG: hypothetical protein C0614_02860 [Desulfuromonas sp.]|nr:MAG: hypothetical protein C0614_02860 [Desulfuromonas sp.]
MTSLRFKIIVGLLAIFSLIAAVTLTISGDEIGDALLESKENTVEMIFELIDLNVSQVYHQQLAERVATIQERKETLKDLASLGESMLERYLKAEQTGLLSSDSAIKMAISWLQQARFGRESYWFAFDREGVVLSHPNQDQIGRSITSLTDLSGRPIVQIMCDDNLCRESEFSVFNWDDGSQDRSKDKKLGYFKKFRSWGWTLVAVVDISDIEAIVSQRMTETIGTLKESLRQINLPGNGRIALLEGNGNVLISPLLENENPADFRPADLLKKIKSHLATSATPLELQLAMAGNPQESVQAYASYFKPFDWYVTVLIPQQALTQPVKELLLRQGGMVGGIFLVGLLITLSFAQRLSQPLLRLSHFVQRIPHDNLAGQEIDVTPLQAISDSRKDEVGQLATSFNEMVVELQQSVRQLVETTALRERLEGELNIARKIQLGILPKEFPPYPNRKEFDLFATLRPAREVGGDLYDFFFIDDRHLCFTLGDVSDKGMPAAMFMVFTRTLIKTLAPQLPTPGAIMARVNDLLCAENPNTMFVTLIIGILDTETGLVEYANAGHNPPLHLTPQPEGKFLPRTSGPVAGGFPHLRYQNLTLQLQPGESMALYTDGVTEATNAGEKMFGNERLAEVMVQNAQKPPESQVEATLDAVNAFVAKAPQYDDIAMLVLCYHGHRAQEGPPA